MLSVGRWELSVFFSPSLASLRPARCQLDALRRVIVRARIRNAFIQHHCDIAAEFRLDFHCDLRRNERPAAVDVILEFDALFGDFAQFRERENLEPAAIRENGTIPAHEIVQAAKMFDDVESRPNEQMISVSENNLRIQLAEFPRTHCLHRTLCADWHESRRLEDSMGHD